MNAGRARLGSGVRRTYPTALWVAAACLSFAVLMIAASSGPVDIGRVPPRSPTSPLGSGAPEAGQLEPSDVPEAPPLGVLEIPNNALVAALVAVVLGLLVISVAHALFLMLSDLIALLRRRSAPAVGDVIVLPDIDQSDLVLDVDAQLAALARGAPRNAIVSCWLQLEDDVAEAGLPRHAAETSAEFTARVLASSSFDPSPVTLLAALYREARFSAHPMEQADRDRALVALRQVHAALTKPATIESTVGS